MALRPRWMHDAGDAVAPFQREFGLRKDDGFSLLALVKMREADMLGRDKGGQYQYQHTKTQDEPEPDRERIEYL